MRNLVCRTFPPPETTLDRDLPPADEAGFSRYPPAPGVSAGVAPFRGGHGSHGAERMRLARDTPDGLGLHGNLGQSQAMRRVEDEVRQVSATDATVLLLGETGTGKELLATQIHERSPRRARAMVRVNCGAIPATLIESELFGHEKGAFTGALTRQVGRFELADRSTLFLDEIGDLPLEIQVKLLRVLEEREIERLGSARTIRVDTRIITATHRNLEQRVREGTFREDLYYRLNVFPISVPPLRERGDDVELLTRRFVAEFSTALGKRIEAIDEGSLAALRTWPGNVRELRNVVERAMITAAGHRVVIRCPRTRSKVRPVAPARRRGRITSGRSWRARSGGFAARRGRRPPGSAADDARDAHGEAD